MQATPGHAYRLVDEIREVLRLREGMTEAGLSTDAIERAVSTLRLFKQFCESTDTDLILPTATSAVREATNGKKFVKRVRREVGLDLQVLSGEREAYCATVGALNEHSMNRGVVVDIGGGSAQISEVREGGFKQGSSLPLGALALTERFVRSDPVKRAEFKAIQEEIASQLDSVPWLKARRGQAVVGLGGTIRNLARIEAKRQDYPLGTLHGFTLSQDSIQESIEVFRSLHLSKRKDIPGLNNDRADIILPGAMTLLSVLDRLETEALTISVNGLREGVFFEQFFWKDRPTAIVEDVRRFGVLNMARSYRYHEQHAEYVRYLTDQLFTQSASLHGYGAAEQEMLEAAAILHDLGTVVNYEDHHKHSQMLIINNGLPGYTPREIALIALLTRFHRRGDPAIDGFASVTQKGDKTLLLEMSALLRLAEYLERGRNGAVEDVKVSWDEDSLCLSLIAKRYPAVELWDTERNAVPLVERAFKRKVTITGPSAPDG